MTTRSIFHADTVLIVEDDIQIRHAIAAALRDTAHRVVQVSSGREGIAFVEGDRPDLIVLDLGLPDQEGVDVCRALRERSSAPIVVVSARHSDAEKVQLLNAGADDYVTKPFSVPELIARVQAQIRRASLYSSEELPVIRTGGLTIDLTSRAVARGGETVHLTPVEWNILRVLALRAGRTLTHRQLYHAVWGRPFGNPQQHLRVHITNLRRKIERDPGAPELIVTEPGVGYRLEVLG